MCSASKIATASEIALRATSLVNEFDLAARRVRFARIAAIWRIVLVIVGSIAIGFRVDFP